MSLRSILDALRSIPPARTRAVGHPGMFRPRLEPLGERALPSFTPVASYDLGARTVLAADFNNDAVPDLALNTGEVLLGHGDGNFDAPVDSDVGYSSIAVGDLDGDGNLDLVAVGGGVRLFLGHGDGTFAAPSSIDIGAASVAVGDFNGDGLLDLGAASDVYIQDGYDPYYGPFGHYEGYASVILGNGDGTFSGPNTTALGYGGYSNVAAADFDGDGIDDLVIVRSNFGSSGVSVLSGDASGCLQGPVDFGTGYHYSVAVADVDGDLDADLVTTNYSYTAQVGGVSVLLGDGAGGFGSPQGYAAGSPFRVAVADFNGDGKLDIATTWYTSTASGSDTSKISVLLGYGDGTFASPITQDLDAGPNASDLTAADFDGDGLLDVAVTRVVGPGAGSRVDVLLNAGGWTFPATLAVGDATVTEGDGGMVEAVFTVTRGGNLDTAVTVTFSTGDGDATAGGDYVAQSGTLTFGPGETTKTIRVLVKGDLTDEYDQRFYVNLSPATGANILDGQGVCTILDDDPPPTVTITAKVSGKEGNNSSTFTFFVTLSAPSEKEVRVSFATADGTATAADNDYVAKSGTLVFAPGQTSKSIPVTVKGDKKKESNETFFVNLTGATGATIAGPQGVGEILDDDNRP